MVVRSCAEHIVYCYPIVVTDDEFIVDYTRPCWQRRESGHGKRILISAVISMPGYKSDAPAILLREDAISIMLDLMNPVGAIWRRSSPRVAGYSDVDFIL
jgi:hypothetical protein